MGEVYRAVDTRLDRIVAVKVLSSYYSENTQVRERFEREARLISALNHPHICALFDIGREDKTYYLVMEYIEGQRLKGPYSLTETLHLAFQILDALTAAHRRGIVHRDLKPANVLVTRNGIKLLDFGLAKATVPMLIRSSSGETSPEIDDTLPMTLQGALIGTVPYMAPEQLEAKDADARTDIYAFGTLFYEMITGKHVFNRSSQASLIGAIMAEPPPHINIPAALERVVNRCLEKDPDERWQSAQDVRLAIELAREPAKQDDSASLRWPTRRLALGAALAGAALTAFAVLRLSSPIAQLSRADIVPPKGITSVNWPELSPDGHLLAYGVSPPSGSKIWIRPLDSTVTRALAGVENANTTTLFWSPDSRSLGFIKQNGRLTRIDVATGVIREICSTGAMTQMRPAWSSQGVIVFADLRDGRLFQVPADGGTPQPVTIVDKTRHHHHGNPFFLPDGRRFLYVAVGNATDQTELMLGSLDGRTNEPGIRIPSARPVYAPGKPAELLLVRDNTLTAQRFDVDHMRLEGDPVPVADSVYWSVSAAANGVLAYVSPPRQLGQLKWRTRQGVPLTTVGDTYVNMNLIGVGPDFSRIALSLHPDTADSPFDLFILDTGRNALSRLTTDGGANPVWSPDGRRIAYVRVRYGSNSLLVRNADGSGGPETLYQSHSSATPTDWSRDGRFLLFAQLSDRGDGGNDLWVLPFGGKPYPLLTSRFAETDGHFSPDGKWIAFASNETGRNEVYVQRFDAGSAGRGNVPAAPRKWQVSVGGGNAPRWRQDGKELFYRSGRELFAVGVSAGAAGFAAGSPQQMFESEVRFVTYEPTADGQRFLLDTRMEADDLRPIHLIFNWRAALEK